MQVRGRRTNIGKGIAFVEFKSKAAAAAAMRLAEPKLHGRPLRITFLKQPKASAVAGADGAPVANIGKPLCLQLRAADTRIPRPCIEMTRQYAYCAAACLL